VESIHFVVPGKPFGKQRPRVACRGKFSKAYTPKETMAYENLIKLFYTQKANGEMFPEDAELEIVIIANYEIPKAASKVKREKMLSGEIRPTKRPDLDNVAKAIYDSLNKVAYHDDAAIVESRVSKFYSDNPRVEVIIRQINH